MSALLCTDSLDYFPIRHGLAPSQIGLRRLPSYQEKAKNQIFQIGNDWHTALENKRACRAERLSKYYQTHSAASDHRAICAWIIDQLCREWPDKFSRTFLHASEDFDLTCAHTGDTLAIRDGALQIAQSDIVSFADPVDLFDAIAMQIPEDLVIQSCASDFSSDHCSRIHLCHANGWSAEWAVGKSFDAIHARVPRIQTIIRDTSKILRAIVSSTAPMERVGAVNFRTSPILNRHPEIPEEKRHQPFHHLNHPYLFLRFERQCVVGFADSRDFLFTIRTYLTQISPRMPLDKWESFLLCLNADSDGTNPDRFLNSNREELLRWTCAPA